MNNDHSQGAPEVSVVIPVYNVEKFLRDCVDSVRKQTFQGFEIILVDDGATDNSPALCDAYARECENIRVIHRENGGLSAARNTGLAAAKGKYVYFLDSDDWIVPHALQTLIDIAERENADAVLFEACVVDEDGRPIYHAGYTDYYSRKIVYQACRTGKQLFQELSQNGDYLPAVPLMLMRRGAVTIPFTPILHEDELFTPQFLYSIDRACTCGEALYVRRVRAASITSERKTHRHFSGMSTGARALMQHPMADRALRAHACKLASSALGIDAALSSAEKRKAAAEKKLLIKTLLALRTPRALITAGFLMIPFLYSLHQLFKRSIPNWVYRMHTYFRDRKRFLPALQQLSSASKTQERILLIGSPEHGNLGDHAIAEAEKRFFREHCAGTEVVDISMPFYRAYHRRIGTLARQTDRIAISGGGWLGNVWYHNEKTVLDIVKRFPNNRIVILPQTIWYQHARNKSRQMLRARRIYHAHKNLTLLLREKDSLAISKTLCPDARYCPDMCLYLDERKPREREGVLLCFRQDREKTLGDGVVRAIEDFLLEQGVFFRYTTTVLSKPVFGAQSALALEKKFEEFRASRLVITDRLHAALFSAVTGTPCVAFDNLTKKVSGVLAECRGSSAPYLAANEEDAIEKIRAYLVNEPTDDDEKPDFSELISIWRNEIG